jgi:hypothetical protein
MGIVADDYLEPVHNRIASALAVALAPYDYTEGESKSDDTEVKPRKY